MTHEEAFNQFWEFYPYRQGKSKAKAALKKALKDASLEDIIEGVERYKRHKEPWRNWCLPATFLNQGRWEDEWDAPAAGPRTFADVARERMLQ